MGRIKTQLIKRVTKELFSSHKDEFSNDFEENKKLVEKFADVPSKKLRNIIAGYITRLKKSNKDVFQELNI
ncbi:30S ribosomal protein S17e [Candidatus Woesearchaeota archaeon]|jgi:small subunit ribosomal protein S17e|nr:30S ribosomal protein S17e [Candidatus Woesearchaeota archaeon]